MFYFHLSGSFTAPIMNNGESHTLQISKRYVPLQPKRAMSSKCACCLLLQLWHMYVLTVASCGFCILNLPSKLIGKKKETRE